MRGGGGENHGLVSFREVEVATNRRTERARRSAPPVGRQDDECRSVFSPEIRHYRDVPLIDQLWELLKGIGRGAGAGFNAIEPHQEKQLKLEARREEGKLRRWTTRWLSESASRHSLARGSSGQKRVR